MYQRLKNKLIVCMIYCCYYYNYR